MSKQFLQKTPVVCILALLCTALWGSAFPSIKIGYRLFSIATNDSASQIIFAGIRFTLAGLLVIIFASIREKKLYIPTMTSFPKILTLALFQTILQYSFFYISMARMSSVKGSILNGTGTFFAILLAALFFRAEKLSTRKILGCIVGFIGLVVVNISGSSFDLSFSPFKEGYMLIAALSSGFSNVFIRLFSQKENPVLLSGYQFCLGGIALILLGKILGGTMIPLHPVAFVLLLYMALISAVAYTIWGILLKYNPVSKVSIFGFTIQIFGVLLSAVILKEYQNLNLYAGIALVLVSLGIYLVNHSKA